MSVKPIIASIDSKNNRNSNSNIKLNNENNKLQSMQPRNSKNVSFQGASC